MDERLIGGVTQYLFKAKRETFLSKNLVTDKFVTKTIYFRLWKEWMKRVIDHDEKEWVIDCLSEEAFRRSGQLIGPELIEWLMPYQKDPIFLKNVSQVDWPPYYVIEDAYST